MTLDYILRSSRLQMFFEISVLKNVTIFTGKHLCCSLFLMKVVACNFIKKRLQRRIFKNIFKNLLRTAFFTTPLMAASEF